MEHCVEESMRSLETAFRVRPPLPLAELEGDLPEEIHEVRHIYLGKT